MNKENYISSYMNDFNNININNNNLNNNLPKLVPKNLKNYLNFQLQNCNLKKFKTSTYYYNSILLALFIIIVSIILISKYKGFKNESEIYKKNIKDKEYIMSKLIYYNRQNLDNQKRVKNNLITDLPTINQHPEASLLHRKIYF